MLRSDAEAQALPLLRPRVQVAAFWSAVCIGLQLRLGLDWLQVLAVIPCRLPGWWTPAKDSGRC